MNKELRIKNKKPAIHDSLFMLHDSGKSGQSMLLSVMIISSIILTVTSLIGLLMIYEIRNTTNVRESAKAIFAADAGIECALYHNAKDNTKDCNADSAFGDPSTDYQVEYIYADEDGDGVPDSGLEIGARSYGVSRKINRAFEAQFVIVECNDGEDNEPPTGDGSIDFNGIDINGDGDFLDPGEYPPDPGCSFSWDTVED